uniref:Uncharacterized protein n=1 Tax=Ditylenchus dipsaci TaxID=166011 RepID=A0A915EV74_9BILA
MYHIGWDQSRNINETGSPQSTVYDNIKCTKKRLGTTWRSSYAGIRLITIEYARKYNRDSEEVQSRCIASQRLDEKNKGL